MPTPALNIGTGIAIPPTIFAPPKWTHESVASELRARSLTGICIGVNPVTQLLLPTEVDYIQSCTGIWTPDDLYLTFTRDDVPGYTLAWHLAVYRFNEVAGFMPFDHARAKKWARYFFPHQIEHVRERSTGANRDEKSLRERPSLHLYLEVKSWDEERSIVIAQ